MSYEIAGARHRTVDTNGVTLSVYEAGTPSPDRPTVVFSHGFPELAFTWRHQLHAVAAAGFHALAPDQRGYGESSKPETVEDYDIHHLTGDLVGLLDDVGVERGVFVGHDWGGFVVWQMPLLHPDRTAGVVGLNTPYYPRFPIPPTQVFAMADPNFYILQFQERDVPDRALAEHGEEVLAKMLRRAMPVEELDALERDPKASFIDAIRSAPSLGEPLLTEEELAIYVDAFRAGGFTGPLNWYRNFDRNWETTPELDGATIDVPSLMITAEWDPVLRPHLADPMPSFVPDLEMHQIAECGHWTQQEKPDEVNRLLVDWLTRRFP
jgi:pimeloyl-ACP methyl ester carboxylesterase